MAVPHTHAFEEQRSRRTLPATAGFSQRFGRCRCGLQERRRYLDDRLYEVRFSLDSGLTWIDPLALLRAKPLPVSICPACNAEDPHCPRCHGLGLADEEGEVYV